MIGAQVSGLSPQPSTLFCWSGGGLPGLDIHTGIWKALEERGIVSTENAGTSAGAIMAALNSAGKTQAEVENLIRSLTDDDVRDERAMWILRLPWLSHFMNPDKIEKLLQEELPPTFSVLAKPLQILCTDRTNGTAWDIAQGDLRQAVLASMSIPMVFPPVNNLCDGGLTSDLPLPSGWQSFDKVYLLIAKRPLDYPPDGNMLTEALMTADMFMTNQVQRTIQQARALRSDVVVIWPQVRAHTGALHFNHQLINDAYALTNAIMSGNKAFNGELETIKETP